MIIMDEFTVVNSTNNITSITRNIIPFLTLPAAIWPDPGIIKDIIAASIAFTICLPPYCIIYMK